MAEGSKLLSAVVEQLAKRDVAMGDLLQLMEPIKGKEDAVDACSDSVEAIQVGARAALPPASVPPLLRGPYLMPAPPRRQNWTIG
jgi:hypothetical protein